MERFLTIVVALGLTFAAGLMVASNLQQAEKEEAYKEAVVRRVGERLSIQTASAIAAHTYEGMKRLGFNVALIDMLDTQYPGHPHIIVEINEPVTSKDVDAFVVSFGESSGVKEPYLHNKKAAAFFVQSRDDVPGLDVMFTVEGPRRATFIVSVATKNPSVGALR